MFQAPFVETNGEAQKQSLVEGKQGNPQSARYTVFMPVSCGFSVLRPRRFVLHKLTILPVISYNRRQADLNTDRNGDIKKYVYH